jgi:hypothetical protein
MEFNLRTWWKVSVIGLAAIALVACGGGGGGSSVNKPRLRYVNASPDALPLTFTLDGDTKATGVSYLNLSPNFQEEDQDTYDVGMHEDGDNPGLDAIAAGFANEKEFLIAGVGLKNFGAETLKRLRLFAMEVSLTAPNGSRSRIYVLHAFNRSVGLDTPSIDMRNPGDNPQYKVENIAYGTIGAIEIDASTQTFVARRNASESVYATNTGTFVAGGIYLAIVSGIEGGAGAQAPVIQFVKIN